MKTCSPVLSGRLVEGCEVVGWKLSWRGGSVVFNLDPAYDKSHSFLLQLYKVTKATLLPVHFYCTSLDSSSNAVFTCSQEIILVLSKNKMRVRHFLYQNVVQKK